MIYKASITFAIDSRTVIQAGTKLKSIKDFEDLTFKMVYVACVVVEPDGSTGEPFLISAKQLENYCYLLDKSNNQQPTRKGN